jgi:phospholipid transport system substrate-binding protein
LRSIVSPLAAFAFAGALSATAVAQDTAPDMLLKAVTQDVIELIRQDREIQAGDPAKVAHLVEAKILPHFDFGRMTQLAAARSWPLASPEQQKALTQEFKTLLVRTYSTALSSYRDQEILFKPLRSAPGDTEVTVRSAVIKPGTVPLALDYDMERHPGGWKVFDVKIEGVSLVTTYRETFAGIVRERGIDGLIRSLSDKNRDSAARASKAAAG